MKATAITSDQGLEWAKQKPTWLQKIGRAVFRAWFIKLDYGAPSLGSLVRGGLQLALLLAITSAAYWPNFFEGTAVEKKYAPYYFGAAAALLFLRWVVNELFKGSKRREELENHRELTALELQNLCNNMMKFIHFPDVQLENAEFKDIVQRTLKTILHTVNEITDSIDTRYFQVALLLFQPEQKIEVVARSGGPRLTGRKVDRDKAAAYHVANAKLDWRYVPDLKAEPLFAFEGLSERECPYRSILIIPIFYEKPDGSAEACGAITIDSSRPYEFWNETVSSRIYKHTIPFVRILAMMLNQHAERV